MKKLILIVSACLLLFTACSASGYEKEYISRLENRVTELEEQLSSAQAQLKEAMAKGFATDNKAAAQKSEPAKAKESTAAQSAAAQTRGTDDTIVFITKSGTKYHKAGCKSLSESCIAITLGEAKKKGYSPCGMCDPPK